jgi:hypothetical protein
VQERVGKRRKFLANDGNAMDEDELVDAPRSRQHEDLWHQFTSTPLAKTCPVQAPILRLLIHATYQFVKEDYDAMELFLVSKKGVREEDILDHFYYNREFWRQRVRSPTFLADEHANNIKMVHTFVSENEVTKEHCTIELNQYFEAFEKRCREGMFAELEDVSLFRQVGVDSNGSDVWIRLEGSVRCENIDKVMRSAMGAWGAGAEVAHYLLVLICYKYNVNTGVRRNADQDFGHPYHYLVDQIQIVVQEIYNALIYPRHVNVTLFEPVKDFVSVGIGELCYSSDFVEPGEPMKHLTGDMRFTAERMKVNCPPIEPAGKFELALINEFFARHPKLTQSNLRDLCKSVPSESRR